VDALGQLMSAREFAIGLLWGALAVVVSPSPARVFRRRTSDMGGLAFAFATYLAVRVVGPARIAPISVAGALIVLAVGGCAIDSVDLRLPMRLRRSSLAAVIALTPGALALAVAVPGRQSLWLPVVVFVATLIVGALLHDFNRVHGATGAPFLLLMISSLGVYFTVPRTHMALVMCGVAVPVALLSFPQPLAAFGSAGSAAVAGAFCWISAASGRESSATVIAALGALGLLLGEPISRRVHNLVRANSDPLVQRRPQRADTSAANRRPDRWLLVATAAAICQVAVVLYIARIAAVENTALMALVSLGPPFLMLALLGTEIVPRTSPSGGSHSGRVGTVRRLPAGQFRPRR
jgi:hypothetical protein